MLPGGAAERAMIEAVVVLVARELTDFAKGGFVEVLAVAVEAIFGEIFVIFDAVFCAERLGLCPGFGFNLDKFDV